PPFGHSIAGWSTPVKAHRRWERGLSRRRNLRLASPLGMAAREFELRPTRGPRSSRRLDRFGLAGGLLRFGRHQLVALRAHAEARQPRLLHELVAEGIAERRGRPHEEAATLRVLHYRWPDRAVKPGAEARFAPGFLLALRRVLAELLRRRLRLHPLHRRARSASERSASDRMDSYNRPHAHSVRNVGLGQLLQGQAGARAARPALPLGRG